MRKNVEEEGRYDLPRSLSKRVGGSSLTESLNIIDERRITSVLFSFAMS